LLSISVPYGHLLPLRSIYTSSSDWIYNRSRQEKESVKGQGKKGTLEKMFDHLFADSRGRARILDWFHPHAIAYVSDTVSNEMDIVKETLRGTLDSVTPEFLSTWDLNSTMQNVVVLKAPVLHHILRCAAQSDNAREKNKIKDCKMTTLVFVHQQPTLILPDPGMLISNITSTPLRQNHHLE